MPCLAHRELRFLLLPRHPLRPDPLLLLPQHPLLLPRLLLLPQLLLLLPQHLLHRRHPLLLLLHPLHRHRLRLPQNRRLLPLLKMQRRKGNNHG